METIEGNKLIDKFMEVKRIDSFYKPDKDFAWQHVIKYHTSWEWLMPAWVKFRALWWASDRKDAKFEAQIIRLQYFLGVAEKPEQFFEHIVEAIQWYNTLTKK